MELNGIHHITAVTGNASLNVAFYTQVLGMRLTKKTVNQDDVSAYHLFYGDELGHPGTDLTFFDWPDAGQHHQGIGTVSAISLGVTGRDALNWWVKRLDDLPKLLEAFVASGGAAVWDFHVSDKVVSPVIRRAHPPEKHRKT